MRERKRGGKWVKSYIESTVFIQERERERERERRGATLR